MQAVSGRTGALPGADQSAEKSLTHWQAASAALPFGSMLKAL